MESSQIYQICQLIKIEIRYLKYNMGYLISTLLSFFLIVLITVTMFAVRDGLEKTIESSKRSDLYFALDERASSELVSRMSGQDKFSLIEHLSINTTGQAPIISTEFATLINYHDQEVIFRGVADQAFDILPKVSLVEGRMFHKGNREVIIGERLKQRYDTLSIGSKILIDNMQWVVVGFFNSDIAIRESEVWADILQVHAAYDVHDVYTTFVFNHDKQDIKGHLTNLPENVNFKIQTSERFYAGSGQYLISFIEYVGGGISLLTAFGVVLGISSIGYAQFMNRNMDLVTLNTIGFGSSVCFSLIIFNSFLAFFGSGLGAFFAYQLTKNITLGTFDSGRQLVFSVGASFSTMFYSVLICVCFSMIANTLIIKKTLK